MRNLSDIQRPSSGLIFRMAAFGAALALSAGALTEGHAQPVLQDTVVLSAEAYVGNSAEVVDDGNGAAATDIVTGGFANASLRFEWHGEDGTRYFLTPEISTSVFPSDEDLNQIRLGLFADYRTTIAGAEDWRLQFRVGGEHANSIFGGEFARATLQGMATHRASRAHNTQFRARYRYRDQYESTFAGFDQHEILLSARHAWRPSEALSLVSATVYGDFRRADARKFSYDELGLRLQARYEPMERWTLTGRAKAYSRQFRDDFSAVFPFRREDTRLAAEIELRHEFLADRWVFASLGWDENISNVAIRDFSGVTFMLGLELREDLSLGLAGKP